MPVFEDYHRTIVGYHGTRRAHALAIVTGEKPFVPSRNPFDWLGGGIYFWEYAPQQAWNWARRKYEGEDVAVVAAMIRLGNCFDLVDPQNSHMLVRRYEEFVHDCHATGKTAPKNFRAKKYLDCAVLEFAYALFEAESGKSIDSCRAVYVPSKNESQRRLWPNSWLCHETHIQLCVREPACILGSWLVKPFISE